MAVDKKRLADFEAAMFEIYENAKRHGYRPTDYKVMLDREGPMETARRCVLKPDGLPSGVFKLMELGIPEISVEAVVDEYADLFPDIPELIAAARERLNWMKQPEVQAKAKELRRGMQSRSSR